MKLSKLFRKAILTLTIAFTAAAGIDSGVRFAQRDTPRPLTESDIKTARTIFGDQIDYSKVRIAYQRLSFMQPSQTIITLGNTIYWPGERMTFDVDRTFIHEMAHVWQNQNKVKNTGVPGALKLWAKSFAYDKQYSYKLDSTKKLTDYNMEQQAEIIADYYMLKQKQKPVVPVVTPETSLPTDTPVDSLSIAIVQELPPVAPPKDQLSVLKDMVNGAIKPPAPPKAPKP